MFKINYIHAQTHYIPAYSEDLKTWSVRTPSANFEEDRVGKIPDRLLAKTPAFKKGMKGIFKKLGFLAPHEFLIRF